MSCHAIMGWIAALMGAVLVIVLVAGKLAIMVAIASTTGRRVDRLTQILLVVGEAASHRSTQKREAIEAPAVHPYGPLGRRDYPLAPHCGFDPARCGTPDRGQFTSAFARFSVRPLRGCLLSLRRGRDFRFWGFEVRVQLPRCRLIHDKYAAACPLSPNASRTFAVTSQPPRHLRGVIGISTVCAVGV